tara:strand:+ start:1879 stop:2592 length:714 start_codon:yes stop_codon:yes gene_type:complete
MAHKRTNDLRTALHYFLDFAVILAGVSISFYFEKRNALEYKEELKNQSLGRILTNLEVDRRDFKFNIKANNAAMNSCLWMHDHREKLDEWPLDSIGLHLSLGTFSNTILVDNQEEYKGLQNSGLIELIEHEKIVELLQKKYIRHDFLKKIEMLLLEDKMLANYMFENTTSDSQIPPFMGYVRISKPFSSDIPHHIIERMHRKALDHEFYLNQAGYQMRADSVLTLLIQEELSDESVK